MRSTSTGVHVPPDLLELNVKSVSSITLCFICYTDFAVRCVKRIQRCFLHLTKEKLNHHHSINTVANRGLGQRYANTVTDILIVLVS